MTTPLPELFAAVPALDDPQEPFTFAVEGDRIVGRWDIVKSTTLYPVGLDVESIDQDYRITVSFDAEKGTYDFDEVHTSTTAGAGFGGGTVGGRFEKEFFKGKSSSKSFHWEVGGVRKTDDGVTAAPLTYSFETSRIKEPLFTFLEQHGWHRKKGFLGGLFNR